MRPPAPRHSSPSTGSDRLRGDRTGVLVREPVPRSADGQRRGVRHGEMTAAHRTLPFNTWLIVENLDNRRTVEVRVNDRGPFAGSRILDLSYGAARLLGATGPGVIPIRLRVIGGSTSGPASRDRAFAVQVGAFSAQEKALALQRELAGTGAEASVRQAEVGGRTIYRVRVGRFASSGEATATARRLARSGYAVIVVTE